MTAQPAPPAIDPASRLQDLEVEIGKLRRINAVLMDRVERSMDHTGSPFSLFETTILLESKVRHRTKQLQDTVAALEVSNAAIEVARDEAEAAQSRLQEAIESVREGFALFDASERLILWNSSFRRLLPRAQRIVAGLQFEEVAALIAGQSRTPGSWTGSAARTAGGQPGMRIHALGDGRWFQANIRRTKEGGIVAIYTDITDLKQRDARERARELAEKSVLLQATLNNVSKAVCVFDHEQRLVAWNDPFVQLLDLPPEIASTSCTFGKFVAYHATAEAGHRLPTSFMNWDQAPLGPVEHAWRNDRVIELCRNPMPGGGHVFTFADITDRKAAERALRESETRIRLITDGIPAFIAYIDTHETYRFVNRRYEQLYNRSRTQIEGVSMRALVGEEEYARRKPHVARVLGGSSAEFELTIQRPDGAMRYFHANYIPHFGADREVLGFFSLIQNVTEQRRAAQALQQANEQLEQRVEERTAALTEANRMLHREILERQAIEQALREAKITAEQANVSKTKFIAAASHDLLQPLNAARLFVSALGDLVLDSEVAALVERTDRALSSVEELLEALLDISKLDSGVVKPEPQDFSIGDLLQRLAAEFNPIAAERGLDLRVVPCDVRVHSDRKILRRILQNLISNALRYTARGSVLVGCRRTPEGLRIDVTDTGRGIPEDRREEIFEEFRRLEPSGDGRDRGMGLGLAIVRRMARILDHPILLRSAVGRGSTFSVLVPLGTSSAAPGERTPTRLASFMKDATILAVDNEAEILNGMQSMLEGWGCHVVTALSPGEALAAMRDLPRAPHALLVDYHLADSANGIELIRMFRKLGNDIPAAILTADRSPDVHSTARAEGLALLTKPVKAAQLRALLSKLVHAGGAEAI